MDSLFPLEQPKNLAGDPSVMAVVEAAGDAIISKDLNDNIISWNKGAERIFGYTSQEILGKPITLLMPPARLHEEEEISRKAKRGQSIEHFETVRRHKDGSLIDISLTISPIKNVQGKIIGVSKTARDITSKVKEEEALIKERNHLRTLLDNLPDYIYFKDTQSRFIDVNNATLRVMKCKHIDEVIGKTDFDFYPKEFAQKYFNDERDIFTTGKPKIDIEEKLLNEHNQTRFILTSKVPLRDRAGNIVGLVGIGRDITDRKHAREVLERDKETLEKMVLERTKRLVEIQVEMDKSKRLSDIGTLAAIVGHELRNPLEVIKLAVHNLKKNQILAENKYFMSIEQKLREGNRIIDNLLNYSRIKQPSYEPTNLLNLIDDCLGFPEDVHVKIEKHYRVPENTTVEIDPFQTKEIFINIFSNACQALKNKTGKVEVHVEFVGEEYVCIAFRDNGVGIDEKDLNKIFMPFFTSKSRGTGLGLAICKELVNLHHGNIEVQSRKGEGTTFRVTLPIHKPR